MDRSPSVITQVTREEEEGGAKSGEEGEFGRSFVCRGWCVHGAAGPAVRLSSNSAEGVDTLGSRETE